MDPIEYTPGIPYGRYFPITRPAKPVGRAGQFLKCWERLFRSWATTRILGPGRQTYIFEYLEVPEWSEWASRSKRLNPQRWGLKRFVAPIPRERDLIKIRVPR